MIVIAPLIVSGFIAIFCLALRRHSQIENYVSIFGAVLQLFVAILLILQINEHGFLSLQAGGWRAPFGVSFVADRIAVTMVLVTAVVALLGLVYAQGSVVHSFFHPLYHLLLMGVYGAFLTGDFFNLYVWFEILLLASFVLLVLDNSVRALSVGLKYVLINLIGSAFFLTGLAVLYASAGTLNMTDVAFVLMESQASSMIVVAGILFVVAFGLKAGMFPFYFWLPSSYPVPNVPIISLFAGLLTKVGVIALLRVLVLPWGDQGWLLYSTVLIFSLFTMLSGVLGAASRSSIREILSWHIISQIGYMTAALAFKSVAGVAAGLIYLVHNVFAKNNLFLVSGVIERLQGTDKLDRLGGMRTKAPWLAVAFSISALALAGIPPLSGFWAKLLVFKEGMEQEKWMTVFIAAIVSLLTLFSMLKIWAQAFLKEPVDEIANDNLFVLPGTRNSPLVKKEIAFFGLPILVYCILTISLGIFGETTFNWANKAAQEVMNHRIMIDNLLLERGHGD